MRPLVLLLLLTRCAAPAGPCGAATCRGCCDEAGHCVERPNESHCGANGGLCALCDSSRACVGGVCVPRCTTQNCNGCCDFGGACLSGDDAYSCGEGGAVCVDCFSTRGQCVEGQCRPLGTGGGGGSGGGGSAGGAGGGSAGAGGGAALPGFVVFTTSSIVDGTFGGVAQGDAICGVHAADAGLPGSYMAWLSTAFLGAASRLPAGTDATWAVLGATPGAEVAFRGAAQLRSIPSRPLDRDEHGQQLTGSAWTGTADGGGPSGQNCLSWTTPGAAGTWGALASTSAWTSGGVPAVCTSQRRLYCFQVR